MEGLIMTSVLFRRSLIAAIVVAAGAAVFGCGGGGVHDDSSTASPADVVDGDADVRSSVLVVGGGTGFVAQALSAGLKPGSKTAFDVLVVDGSAGAEALAMAEAAIEGGKWVVVDGTTAADVGLARHLGGMSVEADAVMVMKAQGEEGYVVVAIDKEATAAKRMAVQQAGNSSVPDEDRPVNTVQSVFGL
jgi:hypothetical protein